MEPAETTIANESSFAKVRFIVLACDGMKRDDVVNDKEITFGCNVLDQIKKQLLCRIAYLCEA
jgi:hypothetical protein